MSDNNDPKSPPADQGRSPLMRALMNPIVFIALSIQVGVFVLIGAAIFGLDRGHVLATMSDITFARGLITYLFTTVTVSTAVVLIVSALTAGGDEVHDKQFQRGKEVLSLLLGVFGTIVGFYFGSEVGAKGSTDERALEIAPLRLGKTEATSGDRITVVTAVFGGRTPYKYGIAIGDGDPQPDSSTDANGWIATELTVPKVDTDQTLAVKLLVKDADNHSLSRTDKIIVHATAPPYPPPAR
jgi:hypothetical protein